MPKKTKSKSSSAASTPAKASASAATSAAAASKNPFFEAVCEPSKYKYHVGFGNHFASEAEEGALPVGQNTPQQCPLGLYAEQLSGTAFTVPRHVNQRSWLYRIRPSVCHKPPKPAPKVAPGLQCDFAAMPPVPQQLRWDPLAVPKKETTFVEGLVTYCGTGDPSVKAGIACHYYACNKSMDNEAFFNSDGDFLIVPQQGALDIQTEFGKMDVRPGEICVIQRGIVFSVAVQGDTRGYICEVYDGHFQIPSLGPIGANGLANPRDFETPMAAYEDRDVPFKKYNKFLNAMFVSELDHSPFDVVAWHGNYAPYKYDLARFNAVNSVTFDHLDPSIFTVLTCQTNEAGVAACDFAIFPPRWCVQEDTFRPPYAHRNCMSEFMGLIRGQYDAKAEGFVPGGASLHSNMQPHGPDAATFEKASNEAMEPVRYPTSTMAFMFESTYLFKVTPQATNNQHVQKNYYECWQGYEKHFKKPSK